MIHRLPLTSVRCGGLTTELQREEKKTGANDEAGVSGYQPVRVKRVDLIQVRVYHERKDNFRQLINKYLKFLQNHLEKPFSDNSALQWLIVFRNAYLVLWKENFPGHL